MNLVTPDFGLLFWMVVIFGIVFFLLAKFGFPIITDMVDKRSAKIAKALQDADTIKAQMAQWKDEHSRMLEETRKEQTRMIREATDAKAKILADAKAEARSEADAIIANARLQIEAEKESALRDVRKEIALLSVEVAEKVLRHELQDTGSHRAFIESLVDEANEARLES